MKGSVDAYHNLYAMKLWRDGYLALTAAAGTIFERNKLLHMDGDEVEGCFRNLSL